MESNIFGKTRLYFIDNIRWLMVIFVVLMHINVTYSSMGRWYYKEPGNFSLIPGILFGMYGSFTQAFFMGFLFLIAGYFVPGSIEKKGSSIFIKRRLFRLGIPTLIYMLILHPVTMILLDSFMHFLPEISPAAYGRYIASFEFLKQSGPMWFALALLIFTIIYTLFRIPFRKIITGKNNVKKNEVTHLNIFVLAMCISIITFIVRVAYPIGGAVWNMQIGFFTQYVIFFYIGTLAFRYDLFLKLPYNTAMRWFKIVLFAGIPFWLIIMKFSGPPGDKNLFIGGLTWQSAAFAFWESFFCVGICAGLLVLFRDNYNSQGSFTKFLSDNAFGVYVFHTPILVLISLIMKSVETYPLLKWLINAAFTLPVSFCLVYLMRKLPGMKKLFT
jgi:glucan biosynthesis protein C